MPYSPAIPEEELKNRVARDVFGAFDCARILGKVDFCVSVRAGTAGYRDTGIPGSRFGIPGFRDPENPAQPIPSPSAPPSALSRPKSPQRCANTGF